MLLGPSLRPRKVTSPLKEVKEKGLICPWLMFCWHCYLSLDYVVVSHRHISYTRNTGFEKKEIKLYLNNIRV